MTSIKYFMEYQWFCLIIYMAMSLSACYVNEDVELLARKPPLGWNSFDSYGVYLHEKAAIENLEAMSEKLKPYGYEYFDLKPDRSYEIRDIWHPGSDVHFRSLKIEGNGVVFLRYAS